MGADANVICLGKFNKSLVDCLEYPAGDYEHVKEGTPIITTLFHCNTSSQSYESSIALGVELYDFNTHLIDIKKINWDLLQTTFDSDEIDQFRVLINNEFVFMFRPNY